jgi:catechol 2,3-dioxygenase-like lactoylglutathione lyase family enzyme
MRVRRVLETCLYAADLKAAEAFYRDVLGLEVYARAPGRHVFFRAGPGAMFLVFNAEATEVEDPRLGVGTHGARGPGHVCFAAAESELDRWREWLEGRGVAIEREVRWPGGARSLYFRDPAGNSLELVSPRLWGFAED